MAQPSVSSFFNTRKRAAGDGAAGLKNKRLFDNADSVSSQDSLQYADDNINLTINNDELPMRTRYGRTVKRSDSQQSEADVVPKKMSKIEQNIKQKKLVEFVKKGRLSPRKKAHTTTATIESGTKSNVQIEMQKMNEATPSSSNTLSKAFVSTNNALNLERGLRTPTKQIIKGSGATPLKHGEIKSLVKKELNFDEVKTKITRSAKLQELKASLGRIQELEKTRKAQEDRNRRLRDGETVSPAKKTPVVQLKEFDKIELEVLVSPSKTFKTPTKMPPKTPDKNELMSPRHTDISKRILFSPAKNGTPPKMVVTPAYQRFASLAESSKAGQLPLPYKYRLLIEIFKGVDSVCAMFHNRKECITFKKLKPAVQRMLRKNFTESHLAQIKHLYPEAFIFTQMKMRNYGSTSKTDYFQLVISPNVENAPDKQSNKLQQIDEDNIMAAAQCSSMNPQIMTERLQRFQFAILEVVREYHDKFLKSLDPPLSIPKEKVTRWHPDFDLENCPEIECGHLPQPPNIEKYSSARDILSTARNLFNCSTHMERVMERYEAKIKADNQMATENMKNTNVTSKATETFGHATVPKTSSAITTSTSAITAPNISTRVETAAATAAGPPDTTSSLLKGLPKSLLDKVRAKQAAKALDAMTRRPSQDLEATKYTRLPELTRHLRNVYITERKGVLTVEFVIKKIQNSFRTCLTPQEIEDHLRLLAKEVPEWIGFHEVRKTMYLKIAKDMDLNRVIAKLEKVANEKSK